MELTFIEMFSGIGGFRKGLEPLGYKCLWANDFYKYANLIYKKNYGGKELDERNIKEIRTEEIPEHDLLTAGFPCQAFSIAGKRKGFQETRGTLFFHIVRVAEAKRPKILLLENVKGLLSAQKGYCFYKILQTLDELGYDVEWQVLNSKYFGIPQNRERVFIIGHLRGTSTKQIFPIGKTYQDIAKTSEETQGEGARIRIANTLSARYYKDGSENLIQIGDKPESQVNRVYNTKGISPTLNANTGGRHIPQIKVHSMFPRSSKSGKGGIGHLTKDNGTTYCIDSSNCQAIEVKPLRWARTEKGRALRKKHRQETKIDNTPFGNGCRELVESKEDVSGCVTGAINKDSLLGNIPNRRIRRLTPLECERLQGFPDEWTKYGYIKGETLDYENVYGWDEYKDDDDEWHEIWTVVGKQKLIKSIKNTVLISDTQRYKVLGNAISVPVINYLGKLILGDTMTKKTLINECYNKLDTYTSKEV